MLYSNFLNPSSLWHVPSIKECYELWDTYEMLDNIRLHCSLVAKTALLLVQSLETYQADFVNALDKENFGKVGLSTSSKSPNDCENHFKGDLIGALPEDLIIPKYYVDNFDTLQKERAKAMGQAVSKDAPLSRYLDKGLTRKALIAAALLHDIAKTYTIKHGSDHAMLGAAFVRESTGNPYLAHAVYAHISWHWSSCFPLSRASLASQKCDAHGNKIAFQSQIKQYLEYNPITLPLIVSYADKRVTHSHIVTLDERFENLYERYGKNEKSRARIHANHMNTKFLEQAFIQFGMDLTCAEKDVIAVELKD